MRNHLSDILLINPGLILHSQLEVSLLPTFTNTKLNIESLHF